MRTKRCAAILLVLILGISALLSCCAGKKQKPILSLMSDEELKSVLDEYSVPVFLFDSRISEADQLVFERREIRKIEFDIDYGIDFDYEGEPEQAPYNVLRRMVKDYYGGDLPVIKDYAVRGRPAYEKTKVKLSEMDDKELILTLMEHYFIYEPHCNVSTEDIRGMVAVLEADPDKAAEEVFQSEEYARDKAQNPKTAYPEAYRCMIEELRQAVKLYYGLLGEDFSRSGLTDNKTPLSELDDWRLYALLAELGVLMEDIPESYIPEIRKCVEITEAHMHEHSMASESAQLTYLYEEIYRAVHIYHSDLFPLDKE